MKFGERLERESAPQWSLHNIDYNSLKHHIKVNTTRDQASAIAIPGQQDTALTRFEDELYTELCRQHDRVDLFVLSKADEMSRRLDYLSTSIRRQILRCATTPRDGRAWQKRQRRLARLGVELRACGDDIGSLRRFVQAQVVAFRKILKKYRKWTGSAALGARFRDTVPSHPKSFTRRDLSHLQSQFDHLVASLCAATPESLSAPASPPRASATPSRSHRGEQPQPQTELELGPDEVSPTQTFVSGRRPQQQQRAYWNEYDHGSDVGDDLDRAYGTDDYAIYVDPSESRFPVVDKLGDLIANPNRRMGRWWRGAKGKAVDHDAAAASPLLQGQPSSSSNQYGAMTSTSPPSYHHRYFSAIPGGLAATCPADDYENDTISSTLNSRRPSWGGGYEALPAGYAAHYASTLPSLEVQRMVQHREHLLFVGTWLCFGVAYVLAGIAAVLISTGRHRLRLEVDAGVTVGVVSSLFFACAALGVMTSRRDALGAAHRLLAAAAFTGACVGNGVLLVLVVGNTVISP